jgi:hypothetical protein
MTDSPEKLPENAAQKPAPTRQEIELETENLVANFHPAGQ